MPTTFSAVNATAEATSSAETPSAAAVAWMVRPDAPPSIVNRPAPRPPESALRVISAWSGPGMTISTRAAARNVHISTGPPPVLDAAGTVSFAAGRGEVYPPARGSSQAGTPLVAAALRRGGDVRIDDTYVQYLTGTRSELLYGDAGWSGEYLIAVAVLDRPGWKPFAPPRTGTRQFVCDHRPQHRKDRPWATPTTA